MIQVQQFFFREEYNRLFEDLEFRLKSAYGILLAESFPTYSVQKPLEAVVLFLGDLFFKSVGESEEANKRLQPFLVKVLIGAVFLEPFEPLCKSAPVLGCRVCPLARYAFLSRKLVDVVKNRLHFIHVVGEVGKEIEDVFVDFRRRFAFGVDIFRPAHSLSVPHIVKNTVSYGRKESFLEDDDGHLYRTFTDFIRMSVKIEIHGCHIEVYFGIFIIHEQYSIYPK